MLEKFNSTKEIFEAQDETAKESRREKTEIDGWGEINYFRKEIIFPEKIFEDTGGVKGYIRKTVPLSECRKVGKIKNKEIPFLPVGRILEKLTDGKFPDCTYNHSMASLGRETFKEHKFLLQKLFHPEESIAIMNNNYPEPFEPNFNVPTDLNRTYVNDVFPTVNGIIPVKKEINEVMGAKNFFENIDLSNEEKKKLLDYTVKNYTTWNIERKNFDKTIKDFLTEKTRLVIPYSIFAVLDSEERTKFAESIAKCKEYFYFGFPGLSLTTKGRGHYCNTDPESMEILFGFGSKNQVFKNYLLEIYNFFEFMKKQKSTADLTWDLFDEYCSVFEDIKKLIQDIDKYGGTPQTDLKHHLSMRLSHPLIPIVINHPSIPDLRWCHADYAAFLTQNGYNVIEMVT